jgi:hypothetical protein
MKMKFILIVKYVNKQECLDVNITNQICSLDLAKQLKKLGVKQDSLFYRFDHGSHQYIFCREYEQYSPQVNLDINDGYSAFTSEELGAMLPSSLAGEDFLFISKTKDGTYSALYDHTTHSISYYGFIATSENLADCLANLLIYFLEKKLMDLPK